MSENSSRSKDLVESFYRKYFVCYRVFKDEWGKF